jgi:NADH-quinone oxidoreductase subunit L
MINFGYTIWIVLIPLFLFVLIGFFGNKFKPIVSGIIGTSGLFVSMGLSFFTAYQYFFVAHKTGEVFGKIIGYNTVWLNLTEKLHIDLGVLLDPISVMMLIVITTVSFMVHLYSIGYMQGEKGYMRFFSLLSLFSFSMLGLVVATNIFQMYIFWELVGVSSYLLIGFYYTKDTAVAASKKAFIVTRFADLGFLIGILLLSFTTGTFDFITLTNPTGTAIAQGGSIMFLGLSTMTWSMIVVFMGGAAHLVARCHGGPDAGLCIDPCRYHGCCGRLPGGPHVPNLSFFRTGGSGCGNVCRGIQFHFRCSDRLYTV